MTVTFPVYSVSHCGQQFLNDEKRQASFPATRKDSPDTKKLVASALVESGLPLAHASTGPVAPAQPRYPVLELES